MLPFGTGKSGGEDIDMSAVFLLERIVAKPPSSADYYKPLITLAVVGVLLLLAVSAVVLIRRRK